MILMNNYTFLGFGFLYAAIGFTLLRYSSDGDLHLQKPRQEMVGKIKESWERLELIANSNATEVNWNTSLFVAIASSLIIVGLNNNDSTNLRTTGTIWLVCVFVIFTLQDIVIRWKQAHRKHALSKEQLRLIKFLRYSS